jgi:hypothetical protein
MRPMTRLSEFSFQLALVRDREFLAVSGYGEYP